MFVQSGVIVPWGLVILSGLVVLILVSLAVTGGLRARWWRDWGLRQLARGDRLQRDLDDAEARARGVGGRGEHQGFQVQPIGTLTPSMVDRIEGDMAHD